MSLAGLRKQVNKANQFLSEKIGGVKGTELEGDFVEMEKRVDATSRLVDEMTNNISEYLQPNPTIRAKLIAVNSMSKLTQSGQKGRAEMYKQPEGIMGEALIAKARELGGSDSSFVGALDDTGESFKQLAELKYALEENVKQSFLEPLGHTRKDILEVNHHLKKLEGRRLDFDCKKRKKQQGSIVSDEELRMAEEKYKETKLLSESAMLNLLEAETERVSQLYGLTASLLEYHRAAAQVLERLQQKLESHKQHAKALSANRPTRRLEPASIGKSPSFENDRKDDPWASGSKAGSNGQPSVTRLMSGAMSGVSGITDRAASMLPNASAVTSTVTNAVSSTFSSVSATAATAAVTSIFKQGTGTAMNLLRGSGAPANGGAAPTAAGQPPAPGGKQQPCCKALYDFDPENPGELGFKEGDIINLDSRLDDNWYVGTCKGRTGHFPVNYVQVIVDVPR